MKKTATLFALIAMAMSAVAQLHIQWTTPEITPGSQTNVYKASNTDKAGNTYTIHFTQDPVNHYMTYRFFGYNSSGVKQWQYNNDSCFTDCQDIYSLIVPVDNDGAIFIGYFNDLSGQWQLRIKRIGLNGNLLWQNYWTPPYLAGYPVSALLDHDGNLVVALNAIVTLQNDDDFAFAKFDTVNGSNTWHYEIPDVGGASGFHTEDIRSMAIDSANAIYGCGPGGFDNYYFKISPAGTLDYQRIIEDNDSIYPLMGGGITQIVPGNNDDLYLLSGTGTQTWVQKYEASSGNYISRKTILHDSATTVPVSLVYGNNCLYTLSNYNYFIADSTFSGGHYTNKEYMITKTDTGGTTIWEKTFLENLDSLASQTGSGGADQMLLCNEHLYVLSTIVTDSVNFASSLVLNKVDASGTITWYDTAPADFGAGNMAADSSCSIYVSRTVNLGSQYVHVITQKFNDNLTAVHTHDNSADDWIVFPNPASDVIHISSATKNNFDLQVLNTLGEMVINVKNKMQLNISGLAPGIYLIRLQTQNKTLVKKFIKE